MRVFQSHCSLSGAAEAGQRLLWPNKVAPPQPHQLARMLPPSREPGLGSCGRRAGAHLREDAGKLGGVAVPLPAGQDVARDHLLFLRVQLGQRRILRLPQSCRPTGSSAVMCQL